MTQSTLDPQIDGPRLAAQLARVRDAVACGGWLTLRWIAWAADCPEASASARLRELRRYGWTVERKRAAPGSGTWLYKVTRSQP